MAAKTGVKHGDGSGGGAKRGMPNERDHDGTLGVRSAKVGSIKKKTDEHASPSPSNST